MRTSDYIRFNTIHMVIQLTLSIIALLFTLHPHPIHFLQPMQDNIYKHNAIINCITKRLLLLVELPRLQQEQARPSYLARVSSLRDPLPPEIGLVVVESVLPPAVDTGLVADLTVVAALLIHRAVTEEAFSCCLDFQHLTLQVRTWHSVVDVAAAA